jgi:hypothetical protein
VTEDDHDHSRHRRQSGVRDVSGSIRLDASDRRNGGDRSRKAKLRKQLMTDSRTDVVSTPSAHLSLEDRRAAASPGHDNQSKEQDDRQPANSDPHWVRVPAAPASSAVVEIDIDIKLSAGLILSVDNVDLWPLRFRASRGQDAEHHRGREQYEDGQSHRLPFE